MTNTKKISSNEVYDSLPSLRPPQLLKRLPPHHVLVWEVRLQPRRPITDNKDFRTLAYFLSWEKMLKFADARHTSMPSVIDKKEWIAFHQRAALQYGEHFVLSTFNAKHFMLADSDSLPSADNKPPRVPHDILIGDL